MLRVRCLVAVLYWMGVVRGAVAAFPVFEAVTIDPNIGKVCYAVCLADVNGDHLLDVVAVSENRVQWYENPTWTKHVIVENQTALDNVCLAPADLDGDGRVDFALGAGWTRIGTIQWISRGSDPQALWQVHPIGVELSTHRMSFADVLGTGKPQLVVSPLQKSVADGVRLLAWSVPDKPHQDPWPMTVLDATLNRMHNHTHLDWNGDGRMETLVACEEGVFLIERTQDGTFRKVLVGVGAQGERPELRGAGEIKVGRGPHGRRFLATIEPMHGTQAVVYWPHPDGRLPWQRVELDNTLRQGHAVWTADLTGDGHDEVIIGHREAGPGPIVGPGLYVFERMDESGHRWTKHVIDDGGCAVEDACAADLNGDGHVDLIAGGRATHNVKLYFNRGVK